MLTVLLVYPSFVLSTLPLFSGVCVFASQDLILTWTCCTSFKSFCVESGKVFITVAMRNYPVVLTLLVHGVVQAGANVVAHLADASKRGQFARDESDLRLEANLYDGGDRGSHSSDGLCDTGTEK